MKKQSWFPSDELRASSKANLEQWEKEKARLALAEDAATRVRLLEAANISKRHATFDLEAAGGPWRKHHDEIVLRISKGFLIALCGKRGTGKTQMAACLAQAAAIQLIPCLMIKAYDLFSRIREGFSEGQKEQAAFEPFTGVGFLVIDETHERGHTDFEDRIMTHLIDKRYDNMSATLLISNQTPEAFTKDMGASIMSRMMETGKVIPCNWRSFRAC